MWDIDVMSDGKPVVAYYDAANSSLKVVVATNTEPDLASEWTRYSPSLSCSGEVNLAVDRNNGIHITYLDTDGKLCYVYAKSETSIASLTDEDKEVIDINGSLSYGSLSVKEDGDVIVPCVTYLNRANIEDCIKYAERTNGGWDYQFVPTLDGYRAVAENQISLEGYKEDWKNTKGTDVLTNGGEKSASPDKVDAVIAFKSKRFETAYLKKE